MKKKIFVSSVKIDNDSFKVEKEINKSNTNKNQSTKKLKVDYKFDKNLFYKNYYLLKQNYNLYIDENQHILIKSKKLEHLERLYGNHSNSKKVFEKRKIVVECMNNVVEHKSDNDVIDLIVYE